MVGEQDEETLQTVAPHRVDVDVGVCKVGRVHHNRGEVLNGLDMSDLLGGGFLCR